MHNRHLHILPFPAFYQRFCTEIDCEYRLELDTITHENMSVIFFIDTGKARSDAPGAGGGAPAKRVVSVTGDRPSGPPPSGPPDAPRRPGTEHFDMAVDDELMPPPSPPSGGPPPGGGAGGDLVMLPPGDPHAPLFQHDYQGERFVDLPLVPDTLEPPDRSVIMPLRTPSPVRGRGRSRTPQPIRGSSRSP